MTRMLHEAPVMPAPPTRSGRPAPTLSSLELAWGLAIGRTATPAPVITDPGSVADELDAVVRQALVRAPCVISFSGGRDSSALLAWATDLARREGHPLPIPATLVIPGDSDAEESAWQDQVLQHLGLHERIVITVGDELDCVGPVSAGALERHGVLWPFNTHMHLPIFAAAQGGSVITGFAGDELGRSSGLNLAAQVMAGRRRPNRSDPAVVGLALSPDVVRRAVYRRRWNATFAELPWLRPDTRTELSDVLAAADAIEPVSWRRILTEWWPNQRYFSVVEESFAIAAEPWDVQVAHPFNSPRLLAALAQRGGFGGLGSRRALMTSIFGDVLPASILSRQSKATFSNVLFTDRARAFARTWSGEGVDASRIDVDALRAHWLQPGEPADMRSMALLQTAWLHDRRQGLLEI